MADRLARERLPAVGPRIEGLEQAITWSRGENTKTRVTLLHVPDVDVREVRTKMGLSQGQSMNCNHFRMAMPAYNLNCLLMLFNREEGAKVETLKHTTLATARLRFLFLAVKLFNELEGDLKGAR